MSRNYNSDYSTIFDADKKFIGPSDTPKLRRDAHAFLEVERANQEKDEAGLYFFHAVRLSESQNGAAQVERSCCECPSPSLI